jgi:hypothetical protein
MALSYEPDGTPATEKTDAVDGWQGYLVRKVACHPFILQHVARLEGKSTTTSPARKAFIITMVDSSYQDEAKIVPNTAIWRQAEKCPGFLTS